MHWIHGVGNNMGAVLRWSGIFLCIVLCHFNLNAAETTTVPTSGGDDTCASHPCKNGGICTAFPNAYLCRCPEDYSGVTCEVLISSQDQTACASMPCVNGECVSTGPAQFTCMCPAGWRGSNCDLDFNECTSTPCLNGGTCENIDGGYNCGCVLGFAGQNCETVACSHDGNTYYDGEVRNDVCNQCHCRGGEWLCTKKFCGSFLVRFDFNGDYSSLVQGNEDHFKSSLKNNLALEFSIDESMMDKFVISSGSIHVEFALVPLVDSHLNIEDVAAKMLSTLESDTFYFRYKETSLFVDKSSVLLEKVETPTEEPGAPVISNVTLVVVCVLVSVLLVMAVIIGTVVIIVHRKRSEKTSLGQFRGRESKEEPPAMNNSNTRHHNDLYNSVPEEEDDNCELKNINIDMFKVVNPPSDRNLGPDHV
ncbi:protein crumbs homolog 1-like isoform X4 [Asterias rubens]|uniref:protein crumbs homolog 1-like isoform X4 n=1 Tax=Asterias rubens TaxID=7604 RepID=UPI001454F5A4|nr:protein crumbs homolog 1-like isoform X4 [Asterias rubens]